MRAQKPSPDKKTPLEKQNSSPDSSGSKIPETGGFAEKNLPEPTRFGDWEVNGRCSDF